MPTHTVTLSGDVQHTGLRSQIVGLGRGQHRRGVVFNAADGTVRIVVNGDDIEGFIEGIRKATRQTGADIDQIEHETVDGEVNLPDFSRVRTDDLSDISDKLDVGIGQLREIRVTNQSLVDGQERLIDGQERLHETADSLVDGQEQLIGGQEQLIDGQERLIHGQEQLVENTQEIVDIQRDLLDAVRETT